jgi:hypothetical protein
MELVTCTLCGSGLLAWGATHPIPECMMGLYMHRVVAASAGFSCFTTRHLQRHTAIIMMAWHDSAASIMSLYSLYA